MEVCPRPMCEKCANFVKPCVGQNVECVDVDESKTCVCKKPFTRDESGDCKKCNALRPFSWQCDVGKSLSGDLFETFLSSSSYIALSDDRRFKENRNKFHAACYFSEHNCVTYYIWLIVYRDCLEMNQTSFI